MNPRLLLSLLFISALTAMTKGAGPERTYHDIDRTQTDTVLLLSGPDTTCISKAVEIRACTGTRQASTSGAYGVVWGATSADSCYFATLRRLEDSSNDPIMDSRRVELTVGQKAGGKQRIICRRELTENINKVNCNNSIAAEIDCTEGRVEILAGDNSIEPLWEAAIDHEQACLPTGILLAGPTEVETAVTERVPDRSKRLRSQWDITSLKRHIAQSDNPAEGIWQYLDRDANPRYALPGGNYTLATVADGRGGYDIIYLSGAEKAASKWEAGMIKGHLSPTVFEHHYNLVWFDAEMNEISRECSADIELPAIMRLNFPLLKTTVRLSKSPQDK